MNHPWLKRIPISLWKWSARLFPMERYNTIVKLYWRKKKSWSEELGQFQAILTQNILGWWEFKFIQMKGHVLFQGEIFVKYKIHWCNLQIFFSTLTKPISTKLGIKHPWLNKKLKVSQIKTNQFSKSRWMSFFLS